MTGKAASNVVSQTDSQYYNDDEDSSPSSKSSSTVYDEDLSDEYEFASDSRLNSNHQDQKSKHDEDKYMRELMSFRKDEL
jgi:hypothetical protein